MTEKEIYEFVIEPIIFDAVPPEEISSTVENTVVSSSVSEDPDTSAFRRSQKIKADLLDLLDSVMSKKWRNNYRTAIEHYLCNLLTNKKPDTEISLESLIENIRLLPPHEKKKLLIHFWRSYKKNTPLPLFFESMKGFLDRRN